MLVLDKLLAKLKSQGSRVVLFSQFIGIAFILEDYLVWRNHEYRRLDEQRHQAEDIEQFNADNSNIFVYIICARAADFGFNLITADTIIMYDSKRNLQCDFQAVERIHRIGQKKQV